MELAKIRKQLLRLSGLSFAPTTPEGWHELAKVLQRRCLTMDHVERVIDRWLETEENVPKPVQLAALCGDVPADPALDHPILAEPCDECAPEGTFRMVQRLDRNGETVWCSVRCRCERGRQLAAMDARRAAEEADKSRTPSSRLRKIREIG
jgi:hypothetical protein